MLSLAPFRALRYATNGQPLAAQLSPPYDVISPMQRCQLIESSPTNVVRLILPVAEDGADPYLFAAELLKQWTEQGVLVADPAPALYVYEMRTTEGGVTRGLLGAVELRDPADGVILPHENTMAGPVSDRLALMTATETNLEPIYLVYDGGGPASDLVRAVSDQPPVCVAQTDDGITHRLWALVDPAEHRAVAEDLAGRRALIADGHHRYATYRQLQADHGGAPGPWDRGLTLLVDSTSYGPEVHPIHRVIALEPAELVRRSAEHATVGDPVPLDTALDALSAVHGFAVAVVLGTEAVIVSEVRPEALRDGLGEDADQPIGKLDVSILHRVLVERVWGLPDSVAAVGYAHTVAEAIAAAQEQRSTAVLLRPTPVEAVAAVAASGQRMPRKSTLFTPKPASGVVLRRFSDQ
jgi:uncharacterized protein (DUF1015 family)